MLHFFINLIFFTTSLFAQAAEEKLLNVYNWSNFIPAQIITQFEKETGIRVQYDVYDSDQMLDAKLMSGKTGYDIVVPSDSPFFARQIKLGIYQKIDSKKLKNYRNLDQHILNELASEDARNMHAIPWMITSVGIGYNVTKVKEFAPDAPLNTLAMIFEPKYVKKLSGCGISILNSSVDVISAALVYLGLDPNSSNLEDLEKAKDLLLKIRPYIREINSSNYISNLANGDICVAFGFSGDVLQASRRAREAKNGVDLRFFLPKEGFLIAFDVLAIPKDAPHPENALKFINFLLKPKISAKISNGIGYPSANAASYPFLDAEIRDDKNIFPDSPLLKKSYRSSLQSPKFVRKRNRVWTSFVNLQ